MTLKDVAVKANCSVATVSKALKNSREISVEAKERILEIAKDCGYLKKATTRTAVLGGLKTVIFCDVKAEGLELYTELQKLAKKQGFILIYVSISQKDALALSNQIGAFGLIVKGGSSNIKDEKAFVLDDNFSDVTDFLKEISGFMPERPSRAASGKQKAASVKKSASSPKKEPEEKKEPAAVPQKKEEIWLL